MESTQIGDKQIMASSYYTEYYHGIYGRLGQPEDSYWCPANSDYDAPWLQVDFKSKVSVDGIDTQGGPGSWSSLTKTFTISYGNDGIIFEVFKENGVDKVKISYNKCITNSIHLVITIDLYSYNDGFEILHKI